MKGKLPSIVMVFVALALVLSLVAVAVAPKEASADPGTLKWSEITIPQDGANGSYALWNNSDVGPIAVSPDGGTLFAAVYGNATDTSETTNVSYYLMRSTDGGYGWKNPITKVDGATNITFDAAGDSTAIVDIVVSPDWANDDIVLVATTSNVYISDDRGVEFTSTATSGALGTITSLDVTLDENDRLTMVAGSDTDVYLKTWVGGWVAQSVTYDVLDVAFSPLYAGDGQIVAVTTDTSALTMVRAKFFEEAWAATLDDAEILDETSTSDESVRACIGFPDDYDALLGPVFVGIQEDTGSTSGDIGDVWQIDWSSIKSTATDLNVRGVTAGVTPTDTDIWSIAVSGDADEALILAGPEVLNATAEPVQLLVHYSIDGGASWTAAIRPPSGADKPYLALGSTAYVGTNGTESAFGYSIALGELSEGACWGETGLIATIISVITDVAASPGYAVDGMLYMVTGNASSLANSLWLTTADRITWDRVLPWMLASPQLSFDMAALPEDFPTDLSVFVAKSGTTMILRSDLAGAFWLKTIVARAAITAMTVVDADTLYTGDASGNVWRTTNAGTRWYKPDESEITGTVTSIVVGPEGAILVGSSDTRVYICLDESDAYEFERVGPVTGPGATVTLVAFDADYDTNDTIYAGNRSGLIYRFVIDESTVWDRISPTTPAINLSGLVVMDDGTLYASDTTADAGVWRSVNPSELIAEGGPDFEQMLTDLPTGAVLELLRVVPGSNILFAVNTNASHQLIAFTDTLTGKPSPALPEDESTAGVILEAGDDYGLARVTLVWERMTGALNYSYQVAYDDEFKSIVASGYIAGTVKDVILNPGETYYWRVRVGAVGSWVGSPLLSPWSETWSFTTTLGPGAARPILENPEAGAEDVVLQPVLEWSGLIDATNYELEVARDCDWTDLVIDKTGDNALGAVTTYAVPSGVLDYDTSYCWRVTALSETAVSPPSDTGSYTTMAEPTPAEAAPTPAWVWVVIAIGAILLIALVVLIMRTRRPV